MWDAMLDESQAGIKIARKNINNFRYINEFILMAENEEELQSLLMRMKEKSEQNNLKFNINNNKKKP